jgi:hypothetical protein
MTGDKLVVVCPCCETKLTLDVATGAVLAHERPKGGPSKSLDEAFSDEKKRRQEAADRFAQAVREEKNRGDILDKKFREAMKRAEEDDSPPPPRPFEFD